MYIMNIEITENNLVIFAFLIIIVIGVWFSQNKIEGFAHHGIYNYGNRSYYNYRNRFDYNYGYNYYNNYLNPYYWWYNINPYYPPAQVDLPFEGRNGKISWYSPYSRELHNY
jgi:hypothetical protein